MTNQMTREMIDTRGGRDEGEYGEDYEKPCHR
jgi:hypothetical protein